MPRYRFEPCVKPGGAFRNLDTGQWASRQQVEDALDARLESGQADAARMTEALTAGRLSIAEWETGMATQVKLMYIESAILARGGREAMTPADWGRIGRMLRDQYAYLHKFAGELAAAPREKWPGLIRGRPGMYVNSARQAFWAMTNQVVQACTREKGWEAQERWIAIGDDRTCAWCSGQAGLGWVAAGTLPEPGSGDCAGLSACRCRKEYKTTRPAKGR